MKALVALFGLLLALTSGPAVTADVSPIRFGITAAVVRENLDLYDRWAAYLGRRVGRPVQFVQRRSYREAMELIEIGEHDFSWICSFPYVKYRASNPDRSPRDARVPGAALSNPDTIVQKDSPSRTMANLEGKVFAYSDPDSNSGYIVPRAALRDMGKNPDSFFRHTFFTYSHTETIEAVAEKVADGAAVDSYVWENLDRHQPKLTAKTRIIQRSETFGFPPLIYRTGVDPVLRQRMTERSMTMDYDPDGRNCSMN